MLKRPQKLRSAQAPVVETAAPLGLIAGRGDLPRLVIDSAHTQGRPLYILAIQGQTEPELLKSVPHLWIHFGEIGKALKFFRSHHVKDVILAGAMSRPSLKEIKPDFQGALWLAKIGIKALGDDNLLRVLISLMESEGFKICAANDVIHDLLTPFGTLGKITPDAQAQDDISRGIEILKAMSAVDVGQAIVIQQGLVLGVEAIEGTDALIERAGALQRFGDRGILVKIAKTAQENRADLPTIGPDTIRHLAAANLRGVAIQGGRSLMLRREESIRLADELGLFIEGIEIS